MKSLTPLALALALASPALFAAENSAQCNHATHAFQYPATATVPQVDTYHGVKVTDPFRWLEDANSEQTKEWVIKQNAFTQEFLSKVPQREAITQRLQALAKFDRFTVPVQQGGRYFFTRNDGTKNQAVLYVMNKLDDEPQVLLDPNTLSKDGTVALGEFRASPDGKYLAYSISVAGSDWQEWKVRDIATGKDLPDLIQWSKFSEISWAHDSSGFYYGAYDKPTEATKLTAANYYQKLYFHKIGQVQSKDSLIYQRKDQKEWAFEGQASSDGKYLLINVHQGSSHKSRLYYRDLTKKNAPVVKLFDAYDAEYSYITNQGSQFWLRTDKDAPRGRIVKVDLRNPKKLIEVVPQAAQSLNEAALVNGHLLMNYFKDAKAQVMQYDLNGKFEREVALPGIGSVKGLKDALQGKEAFYQFATFTTPGNLYRYDPVSGESSVFRAAKTAFDSDAFETKQVFYSSRDGTKVPMFITAKKGLVLDGNNPTILYGYGGFDISLTPSFSATTAAWLEMGGVYAVANLRGGGEYGQDWHEAGTKLKKQNVFDDFIAAAEYLQTNRYTQPAKLAISGGSNGGLLVGATMVQRPELFAAAMPAVGVLDMLRFHKFTIGRAWVSDYGSAEDPAEFKALYAYSPLHNLKPNTCYPATLVMTGDHDDRVVPAHSFKFAAALQAAQGGSQPALIRIETKAGHGAGKPISKQIEEAADRFTFLNKVLQMTPASTAK